MSTRLPVIFRLGGGLGDDAVDFVVGEEFVGRILADDHVLIISCFSNVAPASRRLSGRSLALRLADAQGMSRFET